MSLCGAAVALGNPATRAQRGVIAYAVGNGEEEPYSLMAIGTDGTGNRRLLGPTRRFAGGPSLPVWSKDGERLLFERFPDRDGGPGSLWTANPAGRDARRIPLHVGRVPLWGFDLVPRRPPDRVRRGRYYPHPTIYTISVTGGQRRALRHGWYPTWSGDGRHIAFMRVTRRGAFPTRIATASASCARTDGACAI